LSLPLLLRLLASDPITSDHPTYYLLLIQHHAMKLLINLSTLVPSMMIIIPTAQAATERACITADECEIKREQLGIADYYVGDFPTKGCFTKNDKAFFSEGTEEEMSTTDLAGEQSRIWCDGDSSNDLIPMDQLLPVEGGSSASSTSSSAGSSGVSSFNFILAAASSSIAVGMAASLTI
jgi:hypothetical protein